MEKNNSKQNSRPRKMNQRKQVVSNPETSTPLVDQEEVVESDPLIAQRIHDYLSNLPTGYRFMPTDTELIRDYLQRKIANQQLPLCLIHPVNLYRFHPRTLAERHLKHPDGDEVYYFTPRDRKYKNGKRPSRGVAGVGYWKATGSDVKINLGDRLIGFEKTLVFYEGKAPMGDKTNWIMHEYRTCESRKRTSSEDMKLDDWVLCKVREKEESVCTRNKNSNEEEANENNNGTDTNTDTENAITDADTAVKDEEVKCQENTRVNGNNCSTSYQNDYTQSHQDMGLPWPQNPSYPLFNTSSENFNMVNDNYASGSYWEELSNILGTSYINRVRNNHIDFYDQWERELRCENVFDSLATFVDSFNFQGSTNGLNINDSSNIQDSNRGLNIRDSSNVEDSNIGLNIRESSNVQDSNRGVNIRDSSNVQDGNRGLNIRDSSNVQDSNRGSNINEVDKGKQKKL